MFRAMALKELREVRGVALIGLAILGLLIYSCLGQWTEDASRRAGFGQTYDVAPFVSERFPPQFAFLCSMLAIALGLRQTLGESISGTYPFLFHRAATRRWLMGMKIFWGAATYVACGGAALLVYSLWAAVPGHHDSPFFWSMSLPCWGILLTLSVLYFGAFLSGLRPARWFGSRLFPVFAAIAVAVLAENGIWHGGLRMIFVVMADVLMIACILFVAKNRDC